CLATGADGSAYVTGISDSDFTTIKYVSVPALAIALTSTNTAMVSWSLTSTGFDLQQTTNLNAVNWTAPPETVASNTKHKFIIAKPPTGNRYFRLSHP